MLLAPQLNRTEAAALLRPYGFKDPAKADANLQAAADDPSGRSLLAEILEDLLICASQSADPDQALTYFERFTRAAIHRTRLFSYLKDSRPALEVLAKTLGGSSYMAEILIRDPHHFYWVMDPAILRGPRSRTDVQHELRDALRAIPDESQRIDYLRAAKRREMLRIGVRDLLRLCTVEDTLSALSDLAEDLIAAAYEICAAGVTDSGARQFAILGMGKLGGGELNFSSDVDLIYVYTPASASTSSIRLARKITSALNAFTAEGYVYRVDLRLRPEGEAGPIAVPLDAFARYYSTRIETWERLALLKARRVAGDPLLGGTLLEMAQTFIYSRPFDREAVADVRNMKRRSEQRAMAARRRGRNVKLGAGGIREIELIAQALQVRHGEQMHSIRTHNTLGALTALRDASLLTLDEADALRDAYIFLRDVENKLQMANDAQTHSLPEGSEELTICARRLGYFDSAATSAAEQLLHDYERHTQAVNRIFEHVFEKRVFS